MCLFVSPHAADAGYHRTQATRGRASSEFSDLSLATSSAIMLALVSFASSGFVMQPMPASSVSASRVASSSVYSTLHAAASAPRPVVCPRMGLPLLALRSGWGRAAL